MRILLYYTKSVQKSQYAELNSGILHSFLPWNRADFATAEDSLPVIADRSLSCRDRPLRLIEFQHGGIPVSKGQHGGLRRMPVADLRLTAHRQLNCSTVQVSEKRSLFSPITTRFCGTSSAQT